MKYVVKWTESGKKRELAFNLHQTAARVLRGLIVDCQCYDARLVGRKG